MKKIIILWIIFSICSFTQSTYANVDSNNELKTKVEKIFSAFVQRSEKNNSTTSTYKKVKELEEKISKVIHLIKQDDDKYIIYNTLLESSREYNFKYKYTQWEVKKSISLSKYDVSKNFTKKIIDKDEIFLENWVWYTYYFTSYLGFPKNVTPNQKDLDYNNISTKDHLLYLSNEWLVFIKDFKKVKLISDNIIYWIPDKLQFLEEVRDDKYHIHDETDNDFIKLKIISKNLTKNTSNKQEKIDILYDYVLNNITYTQPIDLKNKKIFSWIQTYKNNNWVCEWYVKYFQYLLQFSWIEDVKSMRWYVIDAQDYPQIWHAWTKIGDYYYDPTFDDPIWQIETKQKAEYYYYKLPEDIFYTNRYDYGIVNITLEKSPLTYREQYIKKKLASVFPKYSSDNYNILNELKFRSQNGFDLYNEITIDDFKNNYWYVKVNNFKYEENWKKYRITKYNFFTIRNNEDIGIILKQLNYNLTNYKLFEWTDLEWNTYFRLGFNIETSH